MNQGFVKHKPRPRSKVLPYLGQHRLSKVLHTTATDGLDPVAVFLFSSQAIFV
jgi:hypothetical protein